MKRMDRFIFVWGVIGGMVLVQGNLFAEMVRGQVTAINKQNQSITVLTEDSSGATQGNKELTVRPDAQFAGIQSLDDLEVGDEIQAEVDKKMFRKGEVTQLTSAQGSARGIQSLPAAVKKTASSFARPAARPKAASPVSTNSQSFLEEEVGAIDRERRAY